MKQSIPHSLSITAAAATMLLIAGCASVAQTSTTTGLDNNCKIVMAQPGRINYDSAKATESEKIEARAKLAAIDLKFPASRNTASGFNGSINQMLRDC